MAITETTVFDKVVIFCDCEGTRVKNLVPVNGTAAAVGWEVISPTTTDTGEIAQLDIMRDAVVAGTAVVEYRDGATEYAYDDLPFEYSLVHTLHSIHPEAGWKSVGTMVLNADVEEDSDTGRSDIISQFGIIPERRQPDGDTFEYPLDRWNARLTPGTQITVQRDWTVDDNVTDPNAHDDVIGMFAWLESLRVSGSGTAFGDDILALDDVTGRTIRLDQGTGFPTLDLHVTSIGSTGDSTDGYTQVALALHRVTGETDEVHIDAIRTVLLDATGTITIASDDAPEEPPFGSTDIGVKASYIEFPDNTRIEPYGERIVRRDPVYGRLPLDGSGRRIIRYDDLEDFTNISKYMPTDGSRVVHFGHDATADGNLIFKDTPEHTMSENIGEVYEVRNISSEYDVKVHDRDGGTLINLKPGQQCSFELAESNADGDEEIIAINPPTRRIAWSRGIALPNLDDQNVWNADSASWCSLPWPTGSGLNYIDLDGWTLGTADDPTPSPISSVDIADWDIEGSFQIDFPGFVRLQISYDLVFNVDPPTDLAAVLGQGHGVSLWTSEGGTGTLTRELFIGLSEMSAIGDRALCSLRYDGSHSVNTRFLLLHRIPSSTSTIGTNDDVDEYLAQIEMEALFSTAELDPTIRWVNTA